MKIIKISKLNNGGHRNQTGDFEYIPEGWAVIPEGMETKNFPFGDIEVEKIDGVMTVTKWTANKMSVEEKQELPITEIEQIRADIDYIAIMTGVEL